MTDRDTTATPYKLSADGLVYFRYPDGDAPVVTVADYAELRTKGRADGLGDRISVSSVYVAGAFVWQSDSPFEGVDDDGGIVISASDGGVWVRSGYLREISLDWYVPQDGHSWTELFARLGEYQPISKLTIRSPTQSAYGELDHVVINRPEFHLLADSPYSYQQTALADVPTEEVPGDLTVLRQIETYSERVTIGDKVELYGRMVDKLRGRWGQEHNGLLHVHTNMLRSFDFYGAVTEPRSTSGITFVIEGTDRDVFERVALGGVVTSGGVGDIGGLGNLFPLVTCLPGFEIADPNGGSLGINPDDPEGGLIYPRTTHLSFSMAHRYEGEYISRWGQACTSSIVGGRDGIGSAEAPFKIYLVDKGFLKDNPVSPNKIEDQSGIGKFDGYDNSAQDGTILAPVYIDYIWQGIGGDVARGIVWEASGNSPGEWKWIQAFHVRQFIEFPEAEFKCFLEGIRSQIGYDAPDSGEGYVRNNTISGIYHSLWFQDGPNEFSDITLLGPGFVSSTPVSFVRAWEWSDANFIGPITIDRITIREFAMIGSGIGRLYYTPMIRVGEGNVTITDMVVEGTVPPAGPEVRYPCIALGDPAAAAAPYPAVLNLVNPVLPSGFTVAEYQHHDSPSAPVANSITFQINGITQTLPWTAP